MAKINKSEKATPKIEIVVMKSKIYSFVKGKLEMRISASCFETISQNVITLVRQASERAKADKRATIKPRDFDARMDVEKTSNEE